MILLCKFIIFKPVPSYCACARWFMYYLVVNPEERVNRDVTKQLNIFFLGGRGGSVVELRTPEREVQGSNPTTDV